MRFSEAFFLQDGSARVEKRFSFSQIVANQSFFNNFIEYRWAGDSQIICCE